jgi:translation initiation factor 2B subunit (eIF-2B alpha/beta/delta family)
MGRGRMQYREQDIEQLIDTLRRSARELDNTQQRMMTLGAQVEGDEILLGRAGEILAQALASTLTQQIASLSTELERQSRYVQRELEQLKQAAASSRD